MSGFFRIFDEPRYLARYPDVARLVQEGKVESGEQHWRTTDGPFRPFWYAPVVGREVRVVILTPSLEMGGAEQWVKLLATGLQSPRVRCTSVLFTGKEAHPDLLGEIADKVPIYSFTSLPRTQWTSSPSDAIDVALRDADALIAWGISSLEKFTDQFNGRVVFVSHGTAPHALEAINKASQFAPYLTAVSQAAAGPWVSSDRLNVLYNGVDPLRCFSAKNRNEVRASWGFSKSDTVFGFIGRLSSEKDPFAVLRALSSLPQKYKAVIAGNGNLRTELETAAEREAPGRVRFLGHVDTVGDVFAGIDSLVLASQTEAHSLTLCEAWIAGVPTVCTPVGSLPELQAEHGPLAFIVPQDPTSHELAAAIRESVQKGSQSICDSAAKLARSRFTLQVMLQNWETFLLDICKQPGHRQISLAATSDEELLPAEPAAKSEPIRITSDPIFYEYGYAESYPEVRSLIRKGQCKSGKDHWESVGKDLGYVAAWVRLDEVDWDEYLARNPALRKKIEEGRAHSPQRHFVRYGNAELQPVVRRMR